MTDQQRLLVAMLSETNSTDTDVEHMRILERLTLVDLVGPAQANCR